MTTPARHAEKERATKETTIDVALVVDGAGVTEVSTGLPFFDHMVEQFGRHAAFDLRVQAAGDLHVDAHHTVEDVGIVLGGCLAEALGDKAGIRRFASMALPLDEALVEVALDLSGRPYLAYALEFAPDTPGLGAPPFNPQLAEEFWRAFATTAGLTLHIRGVEGKNTHHMLEASFKGVARCLRDAVRIEGAASPPPRAACERRGRASPSSTTASATSARPRRRSSTSGAAARLVDDAASVEAADAVVLPGVGAFGACARALRQSELEEPACAALEAGVPFFGVCVGFRLLYEGSVESPGAPGLGVFPGTVAPLPPGVKHPQMQWNTLEVRGVEEPAPLRGLGPHPWVYFVHASRHPSGTRPSRCATTGDRWPPSPSAGPLWGAQFHPEKSGATGLALLANFVRLATTTRA